eukprot:CAMPEP_0176399222 /NCGR_PEP_ID=MMETSP0126-20121128/46576_1 /TAXON_ID=141414 ORGANISM="Strombidinopsis acuminatum, Strain SPMC142" /NCGR_SAMPLE_ID=MMETSP0126 /ASSEMBLY_ACC=CAM_ASM_000229 /LENGTH=71 /DNA_ID=CAMNT_0017774651 /DNA_START=594 /DNA_END=809 /DNA_ORIENTATION=-
MPDKPALYAIQSKDFTKLKRKQKAETFDEPNIIKFEGEAGIDSLKKFAEQYERIAPKADDYLISSKKYELK